MEVAYETTEVMSWVARAPNAGFLKSLSRWNGDDSQGVFLCAMTFVLCGCGSAKTRFSYDETISRSLTKENTYRQVKNGHLICDWASHLSKLNKDDTSPSL